MPRFYSYCLPFQSEGNYAFVNTADSMGRRQMKNSRCFKPPCGGKSSTFWKWHCLRKIALESKRLIHTWWTWCQITWKRIFYPIQKSMAFNQECRWNYGSKSLHSFWPPCVLIPHELVVCMGARTIIVIIIHNLTKPCSWNDPDSVNEFN